MTWIIMENIVPCTTRLNFFKIPSDFNLNIHVRGDYIIKKKSEILSQFVLFISF